MRYLIEEIDQRELILHTRYKIQDFDLFRMEDIEGVDHVGRGGTYTYHINIGKLFNKQEVRKKIEEWLKKRFPPNIDVYTATVTWTPQENYYWEYAPGRIERVK